MKNTAAINELRKFWSEARTAYEGSANARDYEKTFEDVLMFIKGHESAQQDLEDEIISIYRDPQRCIPDLLEFCMALLRWPRFREELIVDINEAIDMRRRACADLVVEVCPQRPSRVRPVRCLAGSIAGTVVG